MQVPLRELINPSCIFQLTMIWLQYSSYESVCSGSDKNSLERDFCLFIPIYLSCFHSSVKRHTLPHSLHHHVISKWRSKQPVILQSQQRLQLTPKYLDLACVPMSAKSQKHNAVQRRPQNVPRKLRGCRGAIIALLKVTKCSVATLQRLFSEVVCRSTCHQKKRRGRPECFTPQNS